MHLRRTRWMVLVVPALLLPTAPTAPALSSVGGPRPRVVDATWTTRPLITDTEELLHIRSVDPDGVVSRVNVDWGDGSRTHTELTCFDVGQVARVTLGHAYAKPGIYLVRFFVVSTSRCFGPAEQRSSTEQVRPAVIPPIDGTRPRVGARWITGPLVAGETELLDIVAVDPDGVPFDFWVDFGDGFVLSISILCLPTTPPGLPMRTRAIHTYDAPGEYRVRVWAVGYPSCEGGESLWSRPRTVPTFVEGG